jgi:hypothetical protein
MVGLVIFATSLTVRNVATTTANVSRPVCASAFLAGQGRLAMNLGVITKADATRLTGFVLALMSANVLRVGEAVIAPHPCAQKLVIQDLVIIALHLGSASVLKEHLERVVRNWHVPRTVTIAAFACTLSAEIAPVQPNVNVSRDSKAKTVVNTIAPMIAAEMESVLAHRHASARLGSRA